MNTDKQCNRLETEHKSLLKIVNFRLPNAFKKIGYISALLIFGFLIGTKFIGSDTILLKDVLRTLMLLFLMMASLSKDQIEDEYITHVRSQSYVVAFFAAIVYSISLPLVALVLDILITKVTGDGTVNFHEVSAFEVMFMLICFQLLIFEAMKRFGRA